ncbi:MAG: ribonuclease domain-containing protein [Lachnospiraceae bacterium]|nr:ribonuclease domain-containing protein [Lachnospiraceae bacterium]
MQKKKHLAAALALLLSLVLMLAGCSVTVAPVNTESADSAAGSYETYAESYSEEAEVENKTQMESEPASSQESAALSTESSSSTSSAASSGGAIDENGSYISKDDVALYIHTYSHLPYNFITKKEAQTLGWDSSAGNLNEVAPGMSIGGDRFGNYEGLLPEADGRRYYECDINYTGGYRGAERIIFSNDGLIFYTHDHYKTFEQLY